MTTFAAQMNTTPRETGAKAYATSSRPRFKVILRPSNVCSSPARTGDAKSIALAIQQRAGSRPVQRELDGRPRDVPNTLEYCCDDEDEHANVNSKCDRMKRTRSVAVETDDRVAPRIKRERKTVPSAPTRSAMVGCVQNRPDRRPTAQEECGQMR
jgi:hypothetical protein